jgi:hypothetical protein
MLPQDIKRIMKENERYFSMLEEYDRTGHLPTEKVRRSFTLRRMTVKKLKEMSDKSKKSMSDIIDDLVASGGS